MKIYLMIFFALIAVSQGFAQCKSEVTKKSEKVSVSNEVKYEKLPDDAKLDDQIRINELNDEGVIVSYKLITVEQRLKQIGAKYVDEKLVDENGKEIRFYKAPIRGTSQGFEEDRKQTEIDAKKLLDLKKKYRVIEIFRNPLKFM